MCPLSTSEAQFLFWRTSANGLHTHQVGCFWGGGGGGGCHCCLQVESLRILLAVETPFREGLDEEEDRRSDLTLLFRDPASVPFTQTGLARAGLWSTCPWSRSSSATCPEDTCADQPQHENYRQVMTMILDAVKCLAWETPGLGVHADHPNIVSESKTLSLQQDLHFSGTLPLFVLLLRLFLSSCYGVVAHIVLLRDQSLFTGGGVGGGVCLISRGGFGWMVWINWYPHECHDPGFPSRFRLQPDDQSCSFQLPDTSSLYTNTQWAQDKSTFNMHGDINGVRPIRSTALWFFTRCRLSAPAQRSLWKSRTQMKAAQTCGSVLRADADVATAAALAIYQLLLYWANVVIMVCSHCEWWYGRETLAAAENINTSEVAKISRQTFPSPLTRAVISFLWITVWAMALSGCGSEPWKTIHTPTPKPSQPDYF